MAGIREGKKKIVRNTPRPRTSTLSRSASNKETTRPSGIERAAKESVLESAFQNNSSVSKSR